MGDDKLQSWTTATSPLEAAALWWAAQLVDPEFRYASESSGPDDQLAGLYASAFAHGIAARYPVSTEQATAFAAELQRRVEAAGLIPFTYLVLATDYGPDPDLGAAADAVGIHLSRFPAKSITRLYADRVEAQLGYRGEEELIYGTEEESESDGD